MFTLAEINSLIIKNFLAMYLWFKSTLVARPDYQTANPGSLCHN